MKNIKATIFIVLSCVGNKTLMWQHKLSAIRENRGDELFVREFNRLMEKIGLRSAIRSAEGRNTLTRQWPMNRKEEYVDALWAIRLWLIEGERTTESRAVLERILEIEVPEVVRDVGPVEDGVVPDEDGFVDAGRVGREKAGTDDVRPQVAG